MCFKNCYKCKLRTDYTGNSAPRSLHYPSFTISGQATFIQQNSVANTLKQNVDRKVGQKKFFCMNQKFCNLLILKYNHWKMVEFKMTIVGEDMTC